jgi:hypothetical protein
MTQLRQALMRRSGRLLEGVRCGGVLGDKVDQLVPVVRRVVVAHAVDEHEAGPGTSSAVHSPPDGSIRVSALPWRTSVSTRTVRNPFAREPPAVMAMS